MYKKIFILCGILLLASATNAAGKFFSPLPTPDIEVLNLETRECNTRCLRKLLEEEYIFSFIAFFNEDNQTKQLTKDLDMLLNALEITENAYLTNAKKPFFSIALLFPRKAIGRYSTTTTNTILNYLLNQKGQFNFEIFDSKTESLEDLKHTLDTIYKKGYRQVIAAVTQNGANHINQINPEITIYIPTVHKNQITLSTAPLAKNLIFGGISYEAQINKLSSLYNKQTDKVTSFYDNGLIGMQIQAYTKLANPNFVYARSFNLKETEGFAKEMKTLKKTLNGTHIFLNTPIANSSVILSQLTYHNVLRKGVYSTQINYNPSLLSITQANDRKNFYLANSIMPLDSLLIEQAKLLNVDLEYDWINYATAFGIEYFYRNSVRGTKRFFKENIADQQVQYNIEILSPKNTRFMPL